MKHVREMGVEDEKVVIFGKGPSFDPCVLKWSELYEAKIICINQTYNLVAKLRTPTLTVCCDVEAMNDLDETTATKGKTDVAIPTWPHLGEEVGYVPPGFIFSDSFNLWYFDLWTAKRKVFRYEAFEAPTTYIVALRIAADWGARKVFTNGVDGGKERHRTFRNTAQTNVPNYDLQWGYEQEICRSKGIDVVRLKGPSSEM